MNPSPQSVATRGSSEPTAGSRFRYPTLLAIFVLALVLASSAGAATLTVTSTGDAGGVCPGANCTLRQAIATAAPGDTINFDPVIGSAGIGVITLDGGQLALSRDVNIVGPGARNLVLKGGGNSRIFEVAAGTTVSISGLTMREGKGGVISGFYKNGGGAIANYGTAQIFDCTIRDNLVGDTTTTEIGAGGGIYNHQGAILRLERCTIASNLVRVGAAHGGGIHNEGSMTLANCTVAANQLIVNDGGTLRGAIACGIFNGKVMSLINCTISDNVFGPGAPLARPNVGGLYAGGSGSSCTLRNTIIARNQPAVPDPDVLGTFISEGHNLIGNTSTSTGWISDGNNPDHDFLGGTTDSTALNPQLGVLQNNAGPTDTLALKPSSIAIDNGNDSVLGAPVNLVTDQRGFLRKSGGHVDIGAFEKGPAQSGPIFSVNNADEHDDGGCSTDDCTLLEALNATNANADANTINFAPGFPREIRTSTLTPTGLAITNPVTINGPGTRVLRITGRDAGRVFRVLSANVSISGLEIQSGKVTDDNGGGVYNSGGLTLTDCLISASNAENTGNGGALYNATGGTLALVRCTLRNNHAGQYGGGVYNDGIFSAINSTFSGCGALAGGGIISRFGNGVTTALLRNCTITNCTSTSPNASQQGGGGMYAEGSADQHHLANSIIAGNFSATNPMTNPDLRGAYTSDGHNLIGTIGAATIAGTDNDQLGTAGAPIDAGIISLQNNGGPNDTVALEAGSPAIDKGNDANAPSTDERGYLRNGISDIGAFEFQGLLPVTLANISTRLLVGTGDNALIGGFIITGTQPKKVIIRGIGPSLPFPGRLDNPTLELRNSAGALLASNDDWRNSSPADKQAIIDSTIPPSNDLEAAIVATLPGNASYTAIVRGLNDGTGIGVVEAYDLDRTANSKLANISTRGLVQTGDNVLIAGTIVLGSQSQKVIIRAIGSSLPIGGKLENPTLELRDQNGGLLEANDDWVSSSNKQAIIDSTIPPGNDLESAIVRTLSPANYTAVVRGVNDTTGIAVVEVYVLN